MDLFEQIAKLNQDLTASIHRLSKNGLNLAEAERDYKILLRQECLKLRAEEMPVTLINQIVYGIPEVAEARFKRDAEQANYEANKEYINVVKLQLRLLGKQFDIEWNNAGKGDL